MRRRESLIRRRLFGDLHCREQFHLSWWLEFFGFQMLIQPAALALAGRFKEGPVRERDQLHTQGGSSTQGTDSLELLVDSVV
jgi:hypothetical protein